MSSERCGIIPVMQPETKGMQFVTVTQGTLSLGQSSVVDYLHKYNKIYFPQHTSTKTDCLHKRTSVSNVTSARI